MEWCRKKESIGRTKIVCGADPHGFPSTHVELHSSRIRSLDRHALTAVVFLIPVGTFPQLAHSCLSHQQPLPGDCCPLSCWGPCPLNLPTVFITSQPWLLLSAGFFLIFPSCHFGHNGCLWDLSEWSVFSQETEGRIRATPAMHFPKEPWNHQEKRMPT